MSRTTPSSATTARRCRPATLPTAKGYRLSAEDKLRAEVIERLMCDMEVDIDAICARHGAAAGTLSSAFARLQPLAEQG